METKKSTYLDKKTDPYLLFFVLCLLLYLPSSFLRLPFPPDEFRNLYIAQNMHGWHDFLFPRFVEGFYFEKPPFYFWFLHLFSKCTFFPPLFLPTFFNALIAWALASLNFVFFKKQDCYETGLFSSLLLLTTGIFYGMCLIARMDILFLLLIYLAIYFFWFGEKEKKFWYLVLSSLFTFFAVFTKGAFGILFVTIVLISVAVFKKDKAVYFKAAFVTLFALILVALWLLSFTKIEPNYLSDMIFKQTIARGVNPTGHREPPYYYLMLIVPTMLPWSLLAIGYFSRLKIPLRSLWEKVFLSWFVSGFLILSLVKSKLPMYLLLLVIPLCALTGKFLWEGKDYLKRRLIMITAVSFLFIWTAAYVYCKVSKTFIPLTSFFVLLVFMACVFFMIKKPFRSRFKNFFICWCIFIQLLNFIFVPFAGSSSDYNRILKTIQKQARPFSTIYVREKELLTLSIMGLRKPIQYLQNPDDTCKLSSFLLISKDTDYSCALEKVTRVGKYSIFYKQ